jgi:hypothetical protein
VSNGPVNSRHGLLLELEQLLARTARGDVADASADILNLMNKAYAEGYRDHEASKHELEVTGTQIRNGAGELVGYFADPPDRITVKGTLGSSLNAYVHGDGHLHVWDEEAKETVAMFEAPPGIEFDIDRTNDRQLSAPTPEPVVLFLEGGDYELERSANRVTITDVRAGERVVTIVQPDNSGWRVKRMGELDTEYPPVPPYSVDQAVAEIRTRWAASRAATEPHYVVCLPHDFLDKIKQRLEPVVVQADENEITGVSEAVARGVRETLATVVDQLDAWTEWDARKGLR